MVFSSGCAQTVDAQFSPGAAGRDASVSRREGSKPDQRFPRSYRLTTRRQFKAVYGRGKRVSCACLSLHGIPNSLDTCRLGVTVTRKLGGAVCRNRTKRRLRDLFRRHRAALEPALDLVIHVRPPMLELTPAELEREFLDSFRRLARRIAR